MLTTYHVVVLPNLFKEDNRYDRVPYNGLVLQLIQDRLAHSFQVEKAQNTNSDHQ